ncbi:amidohydrolase family protein [Pseudohalioglobus lutimaris]|nr:amidohydrolase family protein [Pseudohalioglobus lutimaris]
MMRQLTLALLLLFTTTALATPYDVVILNGRVMDPETGLDDIRHVGINGNTIEAVSETPLHGTREIDASGMVVAPGFIDLHTHSPTELGQYYQLFDGVTTALELEAGAYPVTDYAGQISDTPLINFGASVGYLNIRMSRKSGISLADATATPWPSTARGWLNALRVLIYGPEVALADTFKTAATEEDLAAMRSMLNAGIDAGALGIGLPLDYASEAVDTRELRAIFELAAMREVTIFVHVRRGINGDPAGLREALALAEDTGASVHICHISHNAMRNTALFLDEIRAARQRGVDVTTEVLPYNAGSAPISSAVFGRDWQTVFAISYEDVEWASTGERLTRESFNNYREESPRGVVIHHYLKEEWTRRAIEEPGVAIVSDLVAMQDREKNVAPHNGAFTRILGRYVREQGVIDLMTALEKMTLLPARRLENMAPTFKRKGRLQPGMDADITVFDPDTVIDRATYRNPYQEAAGLHAVLVNGTPVMLNGTLVPDTWPGKRLLTTGT